MEAQDQAYLAVIEADARFEGVFCGPGAAGSDRLLAAPAQVGATPLPGSVGGLQRVVAAFVGDDNGAALLAELTCDALEFQVVGLQHIVLA